MVRLLQEVLQPARPSMRFLCAQSALAAILWVVLSFLLLQLRNRLPRGTQAARCFFNRLHGLVQGYRVQLEVVPLTAHLPAQRERHAAMFVAVDFMH